MIINQIVAGLRAGNFSVWDFYARRTLRILPPFLTVLLVSLALAMVILVSPYEWEWFGLSGGLAAIFVSNFYFLSKQDYFDIGMFEKSLLHTWSLSIEEQFYLIAPILLIILFLLSDRIKLSTNKVLIAAAMIIFTASLIGCIQLTVATGRNFAFYLAPWRAWEFVVGGAIGFLIAIAPGRIHQVAWSICGFVGIAAIAAAVSLDFDGGFYPGYAVLLPVFGTALLILFGFARPDAAVSRFMACTPLVAIGLVSYSWYLWHWPLLTMARIAEFGDARPIRDLTMIVASLILAIATYFLLERPIINWRRKRDLRALGPKIVGVGVAASLGILTLFGAVGGTAYLAGRDNPAIVGDPRLLQADVASCINGDCAVAKNVAGFLAGDSHSDTLRDTLQRESSNTGVTVLWPFKRRCPTIGPNQQGVESPSVCHDIEARITAETQASERQLEFFVIFRRWNPISAQHDLTYGRGSYERQLEREFAALTDGGKRRLLVIGPVPEFCYKAANCILRASRYGLPWDRCSLSRSEVETRRAATVDALQRVARTIPSARFVDPIDFFCDLETCRPYVRRSILFKDDNHLSEFGSNWLFASLKEDFLWAFTGEDPSGPAIEATSMRGVSEADLRTGINKP